MKLHPPTVGLTDAAKILGFTRQNIRKLIITNEPFAPIPVYEGTPSIWHLAEILIWLRGAKKYAIDDALIEVAKINMNINIANSWQKVEPNLQENIKSLVG